MHNPSTPPPPPPPPGVLCVRVVPALLLRPRKRKRRRTPLLRRRRRRRRRSRQREHHLAVYLSFFLFVFLREGSKIDDFFLFVFQVHKKETTLTCAQHRCLFSKSDEMFCESGARATPALHFIESFGHRKAFARVPRARRKTTHFLQIVGT